MNKILLLLISLQLVTSLSFGQSNGEKAREKAEKAIRLMDQGQLDESIALLQESQKLDPDNYIYPYEIAYAYVMKKEYKQAIKIMKKVKKYDNINSQVYQMSGNCYSYMGKPEKAIKEYEEGMKRFPNSGNLHLEKGNIFLGFQLYDKAIENYEKGIEVDPTYPSNYFRLAKLFLNSSDKLSGLIYGEIFMNLERTTPRTQEMSEDLLNAYKSSITIEDEQTNIDFCDVIIDASDFGEGNELKLPLCAVFGKHFILAIINEKTIDLDALSAIRTRFIESYYKEDYIKYPNVLFEYQKKMLDMGLFDAYNHYLFQIGAPEGFDQWLKTHEEAYNEFVDWYTKNENVIDVNSNNLFIR